MVRCNYENYYLARAQNRLNQHGGDLPAFAGVRYQMGHGLGSIFGWIRRAVPMFFKNIVPGLLKRLGGHALTTAANIGSDMIAGKNIKESAGQRLMEGAKSAFTDVGPSFVQGIKSTVASAREQSGSGRRRKKPVKRAGCGKRKRQFGGGDIFM